MRFQAPTPGQRTVCIMTWMVSSPTADGSVLLVNLPQGASVHATFSDTGEERDITAWAADLILIGLAMRSTRAGWGDSIEVDKIQVASVELIGADDFDVVFAHPPSGVTATYGWFDGAELLAEGISEQLTAAVAGDIAEVPGDASGIESSIAIEESSSEEYVEFPVDNAEERN